MAPCFTEEKWFQLVIPPSSLDRLLLSPSSRYLSNFQFLPKIFQFSCPLLSSCPSPCLYRIPYHTKSGRSSRVITVQCKQNVISPLHSLNSDFDTLLEMWVLRHPKPAGFSAHPIYNILPHPREVSQVFGGPSVFAALVTFKSVLTV